MFDTLKQFNILGSNCIFCQYSQYLLDNVSVVVFLNINLIHILIGLLFLTIGLKSVIQVCYMGFFFDSLYDYFLVVKRKINYYNFFFLPWNFINEYVSYFHKKFSETFFDVYILPIYMNPVFIFILSGFLLFCFCPFSLRLKVVRTLRKYPLIFFLKNIIIILLIFSVIIRYFNYFFLYYLVYWYISIIIVVLFVLCNLLYTYFSNNRFEFNILLFGLDWLISKFFFFFDEYEYKIKNFIYLEPGINIVFLLFVFPVYLGFNLVLDFVLKKNNFYTRIKIIFFNLGFRFFFGIPFYFIIYFYSAILLSKDIELNLFLNLSRKSVNGLYDKIRSISQFSLYFENKKLIIIC